MVHLWCCFINLHHGIHPEPPRTGKPLLQSQECFILQRSLILSLLYLQDSLHPPQSAEEKTRRFHIKGGFSMGEEG